MAEPMSVVSPEKLNANLQFDDDIYADEPPSSPFVAHFDDDNQENVAPTPVRQLVDFDDDDDMPQSAFRVTSEKRFGLKERSSPIKMPTKNLMEDFEEAAMKEDHSARNSPRKASPTKSVARDRSGSVMSDRSRMSQSPSKSSRHPSVDLHQRTPSVRSVTPQVLPTPSKRPSPSSSSSYRELRDNEGLTVAMKYTETTHSDSFESLKRQKMHDDDFDLDLDVDGTEFNPDATSADIDDTGFSMFSEMPGLDMTKFAFLKQSPTKSEHPDATPRARAQMTPSTARRSERSERTPSPTPRRTYKENDTTNLLLDFTAQIESYGTISRGSSSRGRTSPTKSITEPNLRSYYQNQRSPAKGGNFVPSTPGQSRQLLNLLDFELPPPPTPRSLPTVTIREMESLKSQFQSQISSLTASLSGKEAEVVSLAKAIGDAERRVGEAQEIVRDERSAREYAEAQMVDWKKKGEEVQELLQNVQSEMAHNDAERDQLLTRLVEAERRAEEADSRTEELETRLIDAESKNVDMTTFINDDEGNEKKKIYSELECQTAIAEKVNEIARDLHSAYKAKHEKKIKALKDNYQKKADERCKDLRLQIIRLEGQIEDAEKNHNNENHAYSPAKHRAAECPSCTANTEHLESLRADLENAKARLAGQASELSSLRSSHATTLEELEAERVEKGELVAAAEQMLSLCGEKMEELQQQDLRRSTATAPPVVQQQRAPTEQVMRNTGFLAGGAPARPVSRAAGEKAPQKPSGMRTPGGFGFANANGGGQAPALGRSTSGHGNSGGSKSRLLSNIERMGKGGE
ncbi:hypothetical protein P153DRAFT_393416 [Dothidotthia symphoricarpi CBS 119687]|uniref:Uncharacterized protein n=1 Tax=Dothidotthia symphoricarpi CBS 119687 TaxID=1392245 RepID=A0A6A6ANW5_9PLEO|nr:uncharacterized protein P153DRAFT_393416 [Dothidotthia symphoricarpi CBS 119687]KAF2133609.1 hypothetical protein P153DRAFT_393416 [Dothidotthia symphoricarpi CBS 119687]